MAARRSDGRSARHGARLDPGPPKSVEGLSCGIGLAEPRKEHGEVSGEEQRLRQIMLLWRDVLYLLPRASILCAQANLIHYCSRCPCSAVGPG